MSLSILKRKRNKLNIFLTTNPEKNIPIIKLIKSINSEIVINIYLIFKKLIYYLRINEKI